MDIPDARENSKQLLPLDRLVSLLPDESERDARWGARRQGERIPFCRPVALRKIEHQTPPDDSGNQRVSSVEIEAIFDGWSLNVCHSGMRIVTENSLRAGDSLVIEIQAGERTYFGRARVAWVREEPDGVVAGLSFDQTTTISDLPPPPART